MDVVGVVMGLFDECFDFLLIKYGIVKRVYLRVCILIKLFFKFIVILINFLEAKISQSYLSWKINKKWPCQTCFMVK